MLRAIMLTGLAVMLAVSPARAQGLTPTPEIARTNFNDIAAVFPAAQYGVQSPTGAVIVYNPMICQQIGAACVFFKYHEHGHVALRHHLVHLTGNVPPMIRERDADRWAANNAPPQAIYVAWQLFYTGGSSSNWHTYGHPRDRAYRLCRFAQQAGKWLANHNCPPPANPQLFNY